VRLIKSDGPLKPERKSLLVNHQNFGQDLRLSQNIWDQRSGILNLIHPNSIVSNDYYIFEKRLEKTIAFYWEENRSPEEVLQGNSIRAVLNNNLSYKFPHNFWVESYEQRKDKNHKLVTITHMVSIKDLSQITPFEMDLQSQDTILKIKNIEGLNSFIKSKFYLETNWRLKDNYWKYFKGKIPEELIEYEGDTIHLKVGQLPVRPKSFEKRSSLTLRIKRSFHKNSLEIGPFSLKKSKGKPLEVQKN